MSGWRRVWGMRDPGKSLLSGLCVRGIVGSSKFEGYLLDEANVRCIAVYMHGSGSTRVTVGRERLNEWGSVRLLSCSS